MSWNLNQEPSSVIVVEEVEYALIVGEDFVDQIKDHARNAGYSKARIFVTEYGITTEIEDPDDAPDVIKEGMVVKIVPYEKAA